MRRARSLLAHKLQRTHILNKIAHATDRTNTWRTIINKLRTTAVGFPSQTMQNDNAVMIMMMIPIHRLPPTFPGAMHFYLRVQ